MKIYRINFHLSPHEFEIELYDNFESDGISRSKKIAYFISNILISQNEMKKGT
jgi:hypothetical protein